MTDIINNEIIKSSVDNNTKNISTSSSIDNSSNETKRTRNKPTKAQQFKEERHKLILELENLMGLSGTNRGVLLYDLERNEELKKYLKEIVPEVKKIYKCGTWNYFVNQHTKEDEEISEISLLKSIFKDDKYEIISKRKKKINIDGVNKQQTNFYFLKNINLNNYF
jgi:hypothetical protein